MTDSEIKHVEQIIKINADLDALGKQVWDNGYNEEVAKDYIHFYNMGVNLLKQNFQTHLFAKSRIENLRLIEEEDIQPNSIAFSGIILVLCIIIPPTWIVFYLRNYFNAKNAEARIGLLNQQFSSITFLIKDPDYFKK